MIMKKTICIVHYNTPELTEALVLSIRKWMGDEWAVVIFDNSDQRPFKKKIKGVKVLNNTKGKLVDFDKELKQYADKCDDLAYKGNYASVKHMMSVQKLFELVPDGFILMDSDIILKRDISYIWNEKYALAGRMEWNEKRSDLKNRIKPMCCYLNVPLLTSHGVKYYDPDRCWGLQPGGRTNPNNRYDTGASITEDVTNGKPDLWWRNWQFLEDDYAHFGAASYSRNDEELQKRWINAHKEYWE